MDTLSLLTIIVYSVGACQGSIYGTILWNSKGQARSANRWLALLLFLLSYRLLVQVLRLVGIGHYDTWYYFMLDLSWANGPLLYFYVRALLFPDATFRQKDWLHFLPVVLQMGCSLFVRLQNLYWDGTKASLSWLGYWGYVVWMNYSTIYVIASISILVYAQLADKQITLVQNTLGIETTATRWIKRIIRAFKWFFLAVLLVLVLDVLIYNLILQRDYWHFERFFYYPFFAGVSLLTYWLGIEGFRRKDNVLNTGPKPISDQQLEQLEQISNQLQRLMASDKLYKVPGLKLAQVAERLAVNPYLLSRCLREVMSTKFSDYINELRIQELSRLLAEPESKRYTLLSLAMDAGFNSKSSFNRAVKKQLGILPRELKSRLQDFNAE